MFRQSHECEVRQFLRLVLIAIACAWQVRVLAVNVSRTSLLRGVNRRFTTSSIKGSVHKLLSTKSRQKDFRWKCLWSKMLECSAAVEVLTVRKSQRLALDGTSLKSRSSHNQLEQIPRSILSILREGFELKDYKSMEAWPWGKIQRSPLEPPNRWNERVLLRKNS